MLSDDIKALQSQFLAGVPQETRDLIQNTNEALEATNMTTQILKVGGHFPDFSLGNAVGTPVTSQGLLKDGPLVISFYRGGWCPYCNLELRAYQQVLPQITALGARLVAISPNLPDHSLAAVEKHGLEFEVLSDPGNVLARQCGLVFKLDARLLPFYEKFNLDIPAYNGDASYELPLPATFVVDQQGIIQLTFADTDYSRRLEPETVLQSLATLTAD